MSQTYCQSLKTFMLQRFPRKAPDKLDDPKDKEGGEVFGMNVIGTKLSFQRRLWLLGRVYLSLNNYVRRIGLCVQRVATSYISRSDLSVQYIFPPRQWSLSMHGWHACMVFHMQYCMLGYCVLGCLLRTWVACCFCMLV